MSYDDQNKQGGIQALVFLGIMLHILLGYLVSLAGPFQILIGGLFIMMGILFFANLPKVLATLDGNWQLLALLVATVDLGFGVWLIKRGMAISSEMLSQTTSIL